MLRTLFFGDYISQQAVRLLHVADSTHSVMAVFMDLNVNYTADKSHLRSLIETAAHRESSCFWTMVVVHSLRYIVTVTQLA